MWGSWDSLGFGFFVYFALRVENLFLINQSTSKPHLKKGKLFVCCRATCIEMVTSLAHTPHGRQYLAQQGIIDKISNIIVGAESDPFSGFYLPGYIMRSLFPVFTACFY